MNVDMLRAVQKAILAHPSDFWMGRWTCGREQLPVPWASECGTVACIAGWAVKERYGDEMVRILDYGKGHPDTAVTGYIGMHPIGPIAADVLDLTPPQAERLFMDGRWPDNLHTAYAMATRLSAPHIAAYIAAARIDLFIASNGEE